MPQYVYTWFWGLTLIAYALTILSCILVVLSENRNPIKSLAWVIALLFLPVVGLVFYLFFGRSMRNVRMISRKRKRLLLNHGNNRHIDVAQTNLTPDARLLVKLADSLGQTPLCFNNCITTFSDGATKFETLKKDLRMAVKSIYLQYYIFSDDELGREIADILMSKAREGVAVKVIYDHVGSLTTRNRFFKRMAEAGVDVHPFFRVSFPQLANRINWRNHRKITVIDHRIGYIGGMNIADRYVRGNSDGSKWRDTHFRLEGDIVESLLYSLAVDWSFMKQPMRLYDQTLAGPVSSPCHNDVGIQLVTSGPTDRWHSLALCFQKAITGAKRSVYIQTPYFLPTDALFHALEAAAMAQVDVRVMLPRVPDSWLLRYASYSYISQCLKSGIKIYLYEPGMLHSKVMIVDDYLVTAGSTNFDFRSFENNFEANIFVYDPVFNAQSREIFFADLKHCTKLTAAVWDQRPRPQRVLESLTRLVSPIL